jgi:hypothetical protein
MIWRWRQEDRELKFNWQHSEFKVNLIPTRKSILIKQELNR